MVEVNNMHLLRWNKGKSLTINLYHVLLTSTMDDSVVFTNLMRNTLRVTTQWIINAITNFVEYFGELLALNDGGIDNFSKDTHSVNNARAAAQRILTSNIVSQELKSMFFS